MKNKKDKSLNIFFKFIKIIPIITVILLIFALILNYEKITVENILYFTPTNPLLGGLTLLGFFTLKTVSLVFPMAILYMSSGRLFSLPIALLINSLGLIINLSLPYFLGKYFGQNLYDGLVKKYPAILKLDDFKEGQPWFFVVISRLLKFVPGDITSLIHGSMNINFSTYIFFSFLVRTPPMLSNTFLGSGMKSHNFIGFFVSTVFTWIISISSTVYYYLKKKKKI